MLTKEIEYSHKRRVYRSIRHLRSWWELHLWRRRLIKWEIES
jgi:hypothetical protein